MKIAFIGQKGIPARDGGVERYVERLALNLALSGQKVLVYNRRGYLPENLREYKNIQLIPLPFINNKNLAAITHTFLACLDVIWRRVDIIHFQGVGPCLLCWLPKIFNRRVKIVVTLHSFDYYNDKWSFFAKLMLRLGEKVMGLFSDAVIVLTIKMKNYFEKKYNRDVNLISNGADLYDQPGSEQLLPWGLSPDAYFLSVSRLIRLKGLQYLISAFKDLKTDKKLVIVGDGEYLSVLEVLAKDDPRIIFTGNQSGRVLDQLYYNAYAFVQPSEMEGLSISLLEAMAHETACLVSDIEANLAALGQSGFSFKSQEINDLQDKLQIMLDNHNKVKEAAEAGFRLAQDFTWEKVSQSVLEVYHKTNEK